MGKPFIKKTGFWADSINGLLLRKPYRTYTRQAAPATEQREQAPVSTPTPAPQETPQSTARRSHFTAENPSSRAASAAQVSQHHQEGLAQHLKSEEQAVAIRHAQERATKALEAMESVWEQVFDLNWPEESPEVRSALSGIAEKFQTYIQAILQEVPGGPIMSAVFAEDAASRTPPARFPSKLWERAQAKPKITDPMQSVAELPNPFLNLAFLPENLVNENLLEESGFTSDEIGIIKAIVKDKRWSEIAMPDGTASDYIQETLDKAYAMFGVSTPTGIRSAICWLAAKEIEVTTQAMRRMFEKEVVASQAGDDLIESSTDRQENRPKVNHGSEQESEPRHRRLK